MSCHNTALVQRWRSVELFE